MAYLLKSHLTSGMVGLFQIISKELGRSLEPVSPPVHMVPSLVAGPQEKLQQR
jgi:hypothetical protein